VERVRDIVRTALGEDASAVTPLVGGEVGQVWRADAGARSFVVKFVPVLDEKPFDREADDDRVYGARWSNLMPASTLLARSGVPVPRIHASGTIDDQHFVLMDYVAGDADEYSGSWFAALGAALGKVHAITRPWQGWVSMPTPYAKPWSQAFCDSLNGRLADAAPLIEPTLARAVGSFIMRYADTVEDPDRFVLSHTDGFQGIFRRDGGAWSLAGAIDVEDYQFADQRFVLTGFGLTHAFYGRAIPDSFAHAYTASVRFPPVTGELQRIFQLYYLLVWTRVLADRPQPFTRCVVMLKDAVR
jgi:fructosamine-3-kinase